MPDFDIVVVGAGASGLSVTAGAVQLGQRVALIERHRMGGDCLNAGCVPSKALLAAAHAAQMMRDAGRFGIAPEAPVIDWGSLRTHISSAIAAIAPADSEERFRRLGATVIRDEARFVDPFTIAAGNRRITARRFVVAAGSRPAVPPIRGLVDYWTNETLFSLPERPDHLLILGGGPVGLEMADAFNALGCRVTVIEPSRLAASEDPELVAGLQAALAARGVTFALGVGAIRVDAGPTLVLADGRRIGGSHILVATGRIPNLEALDLPAGRIQAGAQGIVTDSGLRSVSNPRVFAIGDIAAPAGMGPRAFTHVGAYHASVVIRRMLFRLPARVNYAALPRVIYTDPELAQVGSTEAEARAAGHKLQVLRAPFSENDRAVAECDTEGLVKLVVSGGRVIGAGILAPHAGEMISQWTLAIAQRTRLSRLAELIVPYPTRAEAGKRAAASVFTPRLFTPRTRTLVHFLSRLP